MVRWLSLWSIAAAIFLVLDMIWLLRLGKGFYQEEIGSLLRAQPRLGAAALFYLIYVTGLVIFVIAPGHATSTITATVLSGAMFGLVAYAAFDLTNLAILEGFTTRIAIIDIVWGMSSTAITVFLTLTIARMLLE